MTNSTTHWGKLYGSLCLHPKWLSTPAEGRALWTSALSYCMVIGSDGDVPEGVLHMLSAPGTNVEAGVEQLLNSGLWVRTDKGYAFHDWEDHQQTVAERKSVRTKRSEAGKASAEARRKARSEAQSNTSPTSAETPVQHELNTRSTEERRGEKRREENVLPISGPSGRKGRELPLPPTWAPTDAHVSRARERRLNLDFEAEQFRLHVETHDRRAANWNSAFTMWLNKATPRPQTIPTGRPSEGSWMIPRKAG